MIDLSKLKQLLALLTAHTKEIMREPAVLFWGIIFPLLMALGLGIAFTQKTEITRNIAVVEKESSLSDQEKLESFFQNNTKKIAGKDNTVRYEFKLKDKELGNTLFVFRKTTWKNALVLLKRGESVLVLSEKNGKIDYNFDPSNPDAQLTYLKLSKLMKNNRNPDIGENIEPLTIKGTRYIDFLVPGLISMGIMMSSMWGISYSIIEKRSKKLLRRMVATPMKKSYFLISLMTVRIVMNFIEAVLLFVFSYLVFGTIIQGSIPALLLIFLSGNIAFAGIAIFTSSHTSNTEVGNGLINAIVTPMIVLSGIFFSYHNFPGWTIPFIKILPLTMLADGIRSIFIEGAGYSEIILPFFVMLGMGILIFAAGLKIFKWY